jgi:20S proteasome subunit beta 1
MSASLICAGYDHELGRGVIYTIGAGGIVLEEKLWAAGGSGSTYILGHLDSWYNNEHLQNYQNDRSSSSSSIDGVTDDERMLPLQSEEEAIEFVSNAIHLAMERDGSSGGFIRMYVIDRFGRRFVSRIMSTTEMNDSGNNGATVDTGDSGRNAVVLKNFAPAASPTSQ